MIHWTAGIRAGHSTTLVVNSADLESGSHHPRGDVRFPFAASHVLSARSSGDAGAQSSRLHWLRVAPRLVAAPEPPRAVASTGSPLLPPPAAPTPPRSGPAGAAACAGIRPSQSTIAMAPSQVDV